MERVSVMLKVRGKNKFSDAVIGEQYLLRIPNDIKDEKSIASTRSALKSYADTKNCRVASNKAKNLHDAEVGGKIQKVKYNEELPDDACIGLYFELIAKTPVAPATTEAKPETQENAEIEQTPVVA